MVFGLWTLVFDLLGQMSDAIAQSVQVKTKDQDQRPKSKDRFSK
jgi:hypothetical protein